MNSILENNLLSLSNNFKFLDEIKEKTFFITGGNGFIGSAIIKFLLFLNEHKKSKVKIIASVRNKNKIDKSLIKNVTWIETDLKDKLTTKIKIDYIFHTACPTQSQFLNNNPVEVIKDSFDMATNLLNYSKGNNVKGFVYLSSVEVYGKVLNNKKIAEKDLGMVDLFSTRSCYPESKRLLENLCYDYYKEYNVPVKIARLTQIFGAGVNEQDNRVFMQFAKSIINNKDIVLHTKGKSSKSYCYITDAINALFYILFKGSNGEAYNVANEDSYISIKNLAKYLVKHFNSNIKVKVEIDETKGYAQDTKTNLNTKKLKKLGWSPEYNLYQMFYNLIEYLK